MAKNRNNKKKKKSGSGPMDIAEAAVDDVPPQPMDTSESAVRLSTSSSISRKKGVQMKRSKNVRKRKAIAKAISKIEKASENVSKLENKRIKFQSAKSLYD